ncbi:MAG: hypothetical protein AB1489_28460 [Acidobacteriota bacterium]
MMNQDPREKTIKKLFQELRQNNEQTAPQFDQVIAKALATRSSQNQRFYQAWPGVIKFSLAIIMVVFSLLSLLLFKDYFKRSAKNEILRSSNSVTKIQVVVDSPPKQTIEVPLKRPYLFISQRKKRRKPIYQYRDNPLLESKVMIWQWQPPSDFLLAAGWQLSNQPLLKTVPRLDESLEIIKSLEKIAY